MKSGSQAGQAAEQRQKTELREGSQEESLGEDTEQQLRKRLLDRLERAGQVEDSHLLGLIDEEIVMESRRNKIPLDRRIPLRASLFNSLRRLDVLQEFLEDETVTEIMVNGADCIFLERQGVLLESDKKFSSREKLEDVIQQIVSRVNRTVNEANPIVDARLEDGSRVNVVLRSAALNGPAVTIRKFGKKCFSLDHLVSAGTITQEAADFLKACVRDRKNIFVSGGTGSGKTTLLNALSAWIPSGERIITIEDSAELQIQNVKNLVRLEARRASGEGEKEITIRDLIKTALRMRPDRIIVGEVRDGACLDMLQAMNTGHDGSLSTGHGRSAMDMMARLETMAMMGGDLPLAAIREQIASAIDIMVHLIRSRDGSRKVKTILEVNEYEQGKGEYRFNVLYERKSPEGELVSTGSELCGKSGKKD
ncbi:CpaF family protein [Qiania dongpingensis]|uniref:CpaF family protein n=1 Tax=Qiania dongpingensis TaxID=2763669 RepID=A0A7G9G176_9FIRM|nr:CpaF family protein [Qiania dongpingensis]QNM04558.1 CpaF family protein [Qiania dongpingensis]